jgi:hypothetical protein
MLHFRGMNMIRRLVPLALTVTVVLVMGCRQSVETTTAPDPGATYAIKIREEQQGDKFEVSVSETMNDELVMPMKTNKTKAERRFEYTEHIIEMPTGAKQPTKLTRNYKTAKRTNLKSRELKSLSYEGKTVTIEKKNDTYVFTADGKSLPSGEVDELKDEFSRSDKGKIEAMLPKQPVKVGEAWSADPETIRTLFGSVGPAINLEKTKCTCTLTRVYTEEGKQRGVIAFNFDIVFEPKIPGKSMNSPSGSVNANGNFDVVIDGSSREGTLRGTTKASSSFTDGGIELKRTFDAVNEKTVKSVK